MSQASSPQPLLPQAYASVFRGPAFRVIESLLKTWPPLQDMIMTWRSRQGYDDDYQMPSTDMMPLIALSPIPNPDTVFGVDASKLNFAVNVQIYCKGTCVEDLFTIWEQVENAVQADRTVNIPNPTDQPNWCLFKYLCNVIQVPDGSIRTIAQLRPTSVGFNVIDLSRPNNDPSQQSGMGALICFITRPR